LTVGCHGQIGCPDGRQLANDIDDVAANQRLATGDPDLVETEVAIEHLSKP
jgi:hypothetical protein